MILRLGDHALGLEHGAPLIMAVVNASPESFSDGGRFHTLEAQLACAHDAMDSGASIVDVGGESGVTDRSPLPPEVEVERVLPLVISLVADGVPVSVDTWKPAVARAVLDAGAVLINDVSGLRDPAVADACAATGAGLVVMHTRAEPKQKTFPHYPDVVADVVAFLRERVELAEERGVRADRIVVDPGPDFGKTPAETVAVLRHLGLLHAIGKPVLLAVSRKDFIGLLTGARPSDRLPGTLASVAAGVDAGATLLRVHDVRAVRDFLAVRAALRGERAIPAEARLAEHLRREPTV